MNHIIAFVVVAALASTTFADDLNTYMATYEKQMESIVMQHADRVIALGKDYTASLKSVTEKVQSEGNLDKTKAALTEADRFSKEMNMPETLSSEPEIKTIQLSYQKARAALDSDKARSIVALAQKYDQALEKLQKALVSSGKLADAEAARKERDSAGQSDDVASAQRLLANASEIPIVQADPGTVATGKVTVGTVGKTVMEAQKVNATIMVWQVSPEYVKAGKYELSVQHVTAGQAGSFFLVAYTDSDMNGLPDELIAKSQRFRSLSDAKWSSWSFWAKSSHKNLFVGVAFDNTNQALIYYREDNPRNPSGPPEGYVGLGDTVYYTRSIGAKPDLKQERRYTNIRLQLP
jgi:hypothetical protein